MLSFCLRHTIYLMELPYRPAVQIKEVAPLSLLEDAACNEYISFCKKKENQ